MIRLLTLALVLGAAIALGSSAGAAGGDGTGPSGGLLNPAAVHVDWQPEAAFVSISSHPGALFHAHDGAGLNAVDGIAFSGNAVFAVPRAGGNTAAATLTIIVDGEIVAVTDPFWEWD